MKKHVVNFFSDISARPSNNIGEGTIIMRAAVGQEKGSKSGISRDANMIRSVKPSVVRQSKLHLIVSE